MESEETSMSSRLAAESTKRERERERGNGENKTDNKS
jgi:hypothetical protein